MSRNSVRALAGLGTITVLVLVFVLAIALFRGSFTPTVPVTVISDRAGLVMNPDADVKMRGVQVGTVDAIEYRPDGTAALKLSMNPDQLRLIPSNVIVNVASSTVFGAKFVQMENPQDPSAETLRPGQVLRGDHVTVEINTVFQRLTSVLQSIEPQKLNETLGAISKAFNGRGEKIGQTITDFNEFLAELEPSLPNLSRDIEMSTPVFTAYADAAPDLMRTFENTSRLSNTVVEEQANLDAFLISGIGLADIGNEVVGGNRKGLADVVRLLVPTSDLLNEYHKGINCSLLGMLVQMKQPPAPDPGIAVNVSFTMGVERYRYPIDLPKVAASGGPHCQELPRIPFESRPKYLVTDTGANPWKYGNQGIVLNSDGLKQLLFGPLPGPPRNTSQIGHPG